MNILFVADPLESFKTYKDSTFAMMREAARRGHGLLACEPRHLVWQRGGRVEATVRRITLTGDAHDWFTVQAESRLALADTGAVLMRKDPPFDSEFFYATHLLGQAEREGARVFNKPAPPLAPSAPFRPQSPSPASPQPHPNPPCDCSTPPTGISARPCISSSAATSTRPSSRGCWTPLRRRRWMRC